MQAIILCGGRGTRMKNLTDELPKPLLPYLGKSLLEYKFESLPEQITDVILVVGYLGNKIKDKIGDNYADRKISYVEQRELLGTANALHTAKDLIADQFVTMMGDDLYSEKDLQNLASQKTFTMLMGQNNIWTGAALLDKRFFELEQRRVEDKENEFGIPQTLYFHQETHPINFILAEDWQQISAPQDLK